MACNISIIKRLEVALDTNKSTRIWQSQYMYAIKMQMWLSRQ